MSAFVGKQFSFPCVISVYFIEVVFVERIHTRIQFNGMLL